MRLCLVGDKCGKTSIVQRWISPRKPIKNENTIGIDMKTLMMKLDLKVVRVQLWDCSGEKYYQNLLDTYIHNSDMVVVVFDLTRAESFERAKQWIERIQGMHTKVTACIIGNKLDMESKRAVREKTIKRFVRQLNIKNVFYNECSAYTGENCRETLHMIVREGIRTDKVYTIEDFKPETSCRIV